MSDTQVTQPTTAPAPTPEAGVSNADFARMRKAQEDAAAAATAEKARADALAAQLAEIESASLSEVERLRKENAELAPIRDEHGRFSSALQRLYEAELAAVPDDKREAVTGLSATGDWAS